MRRELNKISFFRAALVALVFFSVVGTRQLRAEGAMCPPEPPVNAADCKDYDGCTRGLIPGSNQFLVTNFRTDTSDLGRATKYTTYVCVNGNWVSAGVSTETDHADITGQVMDLQLDNPFIMYPSKTGGSVQREEHYHEHISPPFSGWHKFRGQRVKARNVTATYIFKYKNSLETPFTLINPPLQGTSANDVSGSNVVRLEIQEWVRIDRGVLTPVGFWLRKAAAKFDFSSAQIFSPAVPNAVVKRDTSSFSCDYQADSVFKKKPKFILKAKADISNDSIKFKDDITISTGSYSADDIARLRLIFSMGDQVNGDLDNKDLHGGWGDYNILVQYAGYATGAY